MSDVVNALERVSQSIGGGSETELDQKSGWLHLQRARLSWFGSGRIPEHRPGSGDSQLRPLID